jgi:hypothetical protein
MRQGGATGAAQLPGDDAPNDHLLWVRARMLVDAELLDFLRHGFSLILV